MGMRGWVMMKGWVGKAEVILLELGGISGSKD